MGGPTTWEQCAAAGMSLTAAARHLGRTVSAGSIYAKRHGVSFQRDTEFAERNRERMKALNADPEFNPLSALTREERADYDLLVKKGGMKRDEALKSIGRADLIRGDA